MWIWRLLSGLWAGAKDALSEGGSFVTLPALILRASTRAWDRVLDQATATNPYLDPGRDLAPV
jgi:hypothetical protein